MADGLQPNSFVVVVGYQLPRSCRKPHGSARCEQMAGTGDQITDTVNSCGINCALNSLTLYFSTVLHTSLFLLHRTSQIAYSSLALSCLKLPISKNGHGCKRSGSFFGPRSLFKLHHTAAVLQQPTKLGRTQNGSDATACSSGHAPCFLNTFPRQAQLHPTMKVLCSHNVYSFERIRNTGSNHCVLDLQRRANSRKPQLNCAGDKKY